MRTPSEVAKHKQAFDDSYVDLQERIARDGDVPGSEAYEPYLEAMGITEGDAVLDLGVGFGRLLPSIRKYTADVVGADLSERMLLRAKQYDPSATVTLADACLLPFADGSFDHVVCWAMWENVPNAARAIREVGRTLRPGGRWFVTGKNLMNLRAMTLVYYRWKRRILRSLWPESGARPTARRLLPQRIVGKLDSLWPDRDIPQYPTFLPVFRRQLQDAGLTLTQLDRFPDTEMTDAKRLPEASKFFYYFAAIARRE